MISAVEGGTNQEACVIPVEAVEEAKGEGVCAAWVLLREQGEGRVAIGVVVAWAVTVFKAERVNT